MHIGLSYTKILNIQILNVDYAIELSHSQEYEVISYSPFAFNVVGVAGIILPILDCFSYQSIFHTGFTGHWFPPQLLFISKI